MTSCKPPPTCIDASPIPDANDSRMSAIPYEANLTPMRAHGPSGPHRDGLGACLQPGRPRRARVPPHRRPPAPFCPRREAELGEAGCAAQRMAAAPPLEAADPAPRWTLRPLVGWVRDRFGLRCCRET